MVRWTILSDERSELGRATAQSSISLVAFFLDQFGPKLQVDLLLERGALVIVLVDRARQLHEPGIESARRFLGADTVFDIPQYLVQGP